MVVPFLQNSRFLRSAVLTVSIFSFLVWLYIVARILINNVDVHTPFIDGAGVSFQSLAAFAFGLSALSTFLYLWLWGRFGRTSGMQ